MTRKTKASPGFDPRRLGVQTSSLKSRIIQRKPKAEAAAAPPAKMIEAPKAAQAAKAPKAAKTRQPRGTTGKRIAAGAAIGSACVLTLAFAVSEPAEQHAEGVKAVSLDQGVAVNSTAAPKTDGLTDPIMNLRARLETVLEQNRNLSAALAHSEAKRRALGEQRAAERAHAAALEAGLESLRRERDELSGERARATALAAQLAVAQRTLAELREREEHLLEARRQLFSAAETTAPQVGAPMAASKRVVASKPTSPAKASEATEIMPGDTAASRTQPTPSQRAALRDGVQAYKDGRYEDAKAAWLPLAQDGYAWAQFLLGSLLSEGRTAGASPEAAYAWLRLARDNGVSEAASVLEKLKAPESSGQASADTVSGRNTTAG